MNRVTIAAVDENVIGACRQLWTRK